MAEATFDGLTESALAARLNVPACEVRDLTGSTMDLAHEAAGRGAAAGTLVIANEQVAGRGRGGRRWSSPPGGGLWMTLIERPASASGLDVLSLRVGLYAAEELDALAGSQVRLKWPNDLFVGDGKLAGVLIEARWRDLRVEWVAIGFGLNIVPPSDVHDAAGLRHGASRLQAIERVLPALRRAAAAEGPLSAGELARYAARDLSVGRPIAAPAVGVVSGVGATGELMVDTADGPLACRSGSLVFSEGR